MPTTLLDRVRMREILDGETYKDVDDLPMKEFLARMPIQWGAKDSLFPLKVAFWPGTSHKAMAAYYFGMHKIEKAVKAPFPLFQTVDINSGDVQIACGEEEFEDTTDLDQIFTQPVPGFLFGGGETAMPPLAEREMGACHVWWSKQTGEIGGASLLIDSGEGFYTLGPVALHELLHACGFGHDRHTPGSVMYKHFGDVREMGKPLARAFRQMYGIPDPKKG